MKIFLDSANLQEIEEAISWGVIDGLTTNPTLMAKEKGESPTVLAKKILRLVKRPVSLEAVSLTAPEMVKEAENLSQLASNVVIKIPMTIEGIKAVKILTKKGIKTNVTLVFSATQALLAAKAEATYVSPFLGRLDDIGEEGVKLVEEIKQIYLNYQFKTQIIAASIRSVLHVKIAALIGADIATVPFKVLKQMYSHPLTDKGIDIFLKDWQSISKK